MWLLRLLGVITVIGVGAGLFVFLLTRDPQYLRFSWRLFCSALLVALLVFSLLLFERLMVIPG